MKEVIVTVCVDTDTDRHTDIHIYIYICSFANEKLFLSPDDHANVKPTVVIHQLYS